MNDRKLALVDYEEFREFLINVSSTPINITTGSIPSASRCSPFIVVDVGYFFNKDIPNQNKILCYCKNKRSLTADEIKVIKDTLMYKFYEFMYGRFPLNQLPVDVEVSCNEGWNE